MSLSGDLPDWTVETAPNILSASFNNIAAGVVQQLFQSPNPYRIWAVWVSISVATDNIYAAGTVSTWGAQVGDGTGASLLRVQCHVSNANQVNQQALGLAVPGFTPAKSGGFYTTNLVTDVGITHVFTRANAGILYSIP